MANTRKTTDHATLSPSSSHRWINCPGSVLLESDHPDEPVSEYAEYGTAGHHLAEHCLKENIPAVNMVGERINPHYDSEHYPDGVLVDEEMVNAVQMYLDYCNQLQTGASKWHIEKKVDFSRYVPEGFGTADFIAFHPDILHVVDLKMGKGVRVHAVWNTQGMLYALGAINEDIPDQCIIKISIVQPRLDHISEWQLSVGDLRYWAEDQLMPKAQQAWNKEPIFNPGESQCRFCKAQASCKALAEYSLKTAIDTFTDLPAVGERNLRQNLRDIHVLNGEELGRLLPKVKTIINWANSLERLALEELLAGKKIPGYKLVRGRSGNRKWANEAETVRHLKALGLSKEEIYSLKIRTPVGVLSELKKKNIPPVGVESFWTVPEGKLTIAGSEDVRPEIVSDADRAFTDIEI
jgi:hypothetical protein